MANIASCAVPEPFKPEFVHSIVSSTLTRIEIPQKFFESFIEGKNGGHIVTLVSEQLDRQWKVDLIGRTLTGGWDNFAKAHSLKVGDFVAFRYKGNNVFKVTVYAEDGVKYEYGPCEDPLCGNHGGNQITPKENEAGKSNSSHSIKQARVYKKYEHDEPDAFLQPVTPSNIQRNEFYLPKQFVELNFVEDKLSDVMILTNNDGKTWEAEVRPCKDGRFKIMSVWSLFCYENNLQAGDICKLKLVPDTEDIILKLVELSDEEKLCNGKATCSVMQ